MYDVNAITVNMKVLPFREGSKNITHNCLAPSPTTEKIQDYLELKAITYASFVIFHSKIKQTLLPEVLMDIMCYTLWLCMQAQMFCRCIRFSLILVYIVEHNMSFIIIFFLLMAREREPNFTMTSRINPGPDEHG